jgi:hypothetical protein
MRRSFFRGCSVASAVCLVSFAGAAQAEESAGRAAEAVVPTAVAVASLPPTRTEPGARATETETTVELHANDGRATLERRRGVHTLGGLGLPDLGIGGVTEWEPVCTSPCAMPVSRRSTYRVAGDGLVPSSTFALPTGSRLRLDADLGSSQGRVSGALLTLAGAGALVLGTGALVTSPILAANDLGSEGFRTGLLGGGVAAASVGAILVAVGVTLWVTNESTLRFEPAATSTARALPKRRWLADGFVF